MTDSAERAKKWSIGGALLAALAASSCCLGPLLLGVLGIGGAGATAAFGAYRPYLLGATGLLLAAGFYFAYRRPRATLSEACGCERPRTNRAARLGLWTAAAFVILVAAAPPLLAKWADATHSPLSSAGFAKATIDVQGIDCEACAAPMRKALATVGGFRDLELDVANQTVVVTYEPAPGRLAAYAAAINELGFEATVPDGSEALR